MQVRTAREIGAIIREERKKQQLDQTELAEKVGVNRRWVLEIERGKPRAEVGLVLKALHALGLSISIESSDTASGGADEIEPVDIDAVIENARRLEP
jgi:HTH-type transcriptional regulator / antitoxin HipB